LNSASVRIFSSLFSGRSLESFQKSQDFFNQAQKHKPKMLNPFPLAIIAIYRYICGITAPLNFSIMGIHSPLCGENVGVN